MSRDRQSLERALSGFARWDDQDASFREAHSVAVAWGEPFEPWVLRFMLVDVIGCQDFGRSEKVAWVCQVVMDGIPIEFSFRKFGLGGVVGGSADQTAAEGVVGDCLRRLRAALPLVERKLIQPTIKKAMDAERVTISNQFSYFSEMYDHLRGLSEQSARDATHLKPVTTTFPDGSSTSFPAVERAREAEFEAYGALFALFSMLEHLLVIEMSFRKFGIADENLADFLRLSWSEKFKRVVDISDRQAKHVYNVLKALADENRNPAAHGGIDRSSTNLAIHLDGYGAVPVGVHPRSSLPTYTFHPQLPHEVSPFATLEGLGVGKSGWGAIDEVVAWLRAGPLSAAYEYGTSGLPILLDASSRSEAHAARASGALEELLDRRGWLVDRAANMDW
jgi:hypothetical protein